MDVNWSHKTPPPPPSRHHTITTISSSNNVSNTTSVYLSIDSSASSLSHFDVLDVVSQTTVWRRRIRKAFEPLSSAVDAEISVAVQQEDFVASLLSGQYGGR
eukprot:753111-Hanusia_phi.AAC.2